MNNTDHSGTGFDNLGISPKLLEVLNRNKFHTPTPIQAQSIPVAIEGKDLMGIAQTGTGKTLAFGIPMIQRIARSKGQAKGLIILPTRELAVQVDDTLKKVGGSLGLRTALLMGGESMNRQVRALKQDPHIIIATPGRLIDHIETQKLSLSTVGILVLDEADRMMDMGFAPQINRILQSVPKRRQTMLFSATMPDEIVDIAKSYMHMPLRIEVAPPGTSAATVTQELFFVEKADKLALLESLIGKYDGSILVFCRTKHGAAKITRVLKRINFAAAEIHSNRSLNQRLGALNGFKSGKHKVLVATDIAARGIDVTGIQLVVNFDLPATPDDYVHRIGRTGRAGQTGHAISFAQPDQRREVKNIERLIKKALPVTQAKVDPSRRAATQEPTFRRDGQGRGERGDQGRRDHGRGRGGHGRSYGRGERSGGSRPTSRGSDAVPDFSLLPTFSADKRRSGGSSQSGRTANDRSRRPEGRGRGSDRRRSGNDRGPRGGSRNSRDRGRSSRDRHVFPTRRPGFPQEAVGYFIERPKLKGDEEL